ncbi:cation-translocating P-type ATPase [Pseudozobellia thermophila]|uniref:Ca2+-transporting ATPase n=1 Tax=Pseudozobellia thermophila TaxID=192903 RepID=A0A1M6GCZ4_9FLAO|nr:cation-transporting P-type ATPase [Pseudozobellia thermophila]SHJ07804.1 Ca2+-transporting ATPase [Pseudozobellia thermophila]
MLRNPFAISVEETIASLGSNKEMGLDEDKVRRRLESYGPNEVPGQAPKKRWRILADQVLDPIIYILAVAALLAFMFNDPLEGFAILVVIVISVSIGFFMELQAVRSLEALRKMGQTTVVVVRGGHQMAIAASELVPGDLILLGPGDVVPADARLIQVDNLTVKESALTGESIPVAKFTDVVADGTPISDQGNMVFRGTVVVAGSCSAIVTATGKDTQLGHIQQMGIDAQKESTPLEKKLNRLSRALIGLVLFLAALIVLIGAIRGKDLLLMIETGVALAVAAIPEGLPIVATVALAQGMLKLAQKKVVIKKMEAVQTLGATTVICTDKTGTLTEDRMKVHALVFGETFIPDVYQADETLLKGLKGNRVFEEMMRTGILCNNVDFKAKQKRGDSIELALVEFAEYMEYGVATLKKNNPEILELPFDAERKLMATAHRDSEYFDVYVKGAYENLVGRCDSIMGSDGTAAFNNKGEWEEKVDRLAFQGLRTLAFAHKRVKEMPKRETLLQQLTFLGVVGFIDPAREDVKTTIAIYKKAGIKVVMATGDHPGTAKKIAEEVGLVQDGASPMAVLRGIDLVKGDFQTDKGSKLREAVVFARVTPEQKLNLVKFYQRNNHIVGMIGDGINDVPALKKADIGIAMGIRGTEAAREAADVILKNDKFTAIELAIRQGRVIFQNIRQFVVYLLSCNLAEIVSVAVAALFDLTSPLLPLQILFLNLVTDIFPALALGLGKGEKDIMRQPPKKPKEPILGRSDWYETLAYGLCISAAVLGMVVYSHYSLGLSAQITNNMAFYTLVLAQLLNVFNMPKSRESFFKNEVTVNPWVWGAIVLSLLIAFGIVLIPTAAKALNLMPLSAVQLGLVVLFALGGLVAAQAVKHLGKGLVTTSQG